MVTNLIRSPTEFNKPPQKQWSALGQTQSNSKVKQKTVVLVASFACYIWMVIGKVKIEIKKILKAIFKLIKNYHHSYVKIGNIGDKKLIHSKIFKLL